MDFQTAVKQTFSALTTKSSEPVIDRLRLWRHETADLVQSLASLDSLYKRVIPESVNSPLYGRIALERGGALEITGKTEGTTTHLSVTRIGKDLAPKSRYHFEIHEDGQAYRGPQLSIKPFDEIGSLKSYLGINAGVNKCLTLLIQDVRLQLKGKVNLEGRFKDELVKLYQESGLDHSPYKHTGKKDADPELHRQEQKRGAQLHAIALKLFQDDKALWSLDRSIVFTLENRKQSAFLDWLSEPPMKL